MAVDQTLLREKEEVERKREQEMVSDISESHPSLAWMPAQPTERHSWAWLLLESYDVN